MNCKPGDLAVIVRGDIQENFGAFVEVIERWSDTDGRPCWCVRASRKCRTSTGIWSREGICYDDCLQPIRPPRQSVTEGRDMEVTA